MNSLLRSQRVSRHVATAVATRNYATRRVVASTTLRCATASQAQSILPLLVRSFSDAPNRKTDDNNDEALLMFETVEGLHPISRQTLVAKGFKQMTEIQAKTFEAVKNGQDVIGRARTGTGKTLAFLLPSIERILAMQAESGPSGMIDCVVISPTRELADQIYNEARMLIQNHPTVHAQVVYGGVPKRQDIGKLEMQIPNILVGTPGRIQDCIENLHSIRRRPFADYVKNTPILVLDEMDRLVRFDCGFLSFCFLPVVLHNCF
jgi:superfamily II DNA/RNA helicase